jgi:hypothetical protein
LKDELKNKHNETKTISLIIVEENLQIDMLTDEIRKLNKKISDVEVRIKKLMMKIFSLFREKRRILEMVLFCLGNI